MGAQKMYDPLTAKSASFFSSKCSETKVYGQIFLQGCTRTLKNKNKRDT